MQRPRNRCGGQRERVHLCAHLTQLFLCRHAEPVLFIDDQEAEVLERHVFGQQPVCTDDNIQRPVAQPCKDGFLLFLGLEAGEALDATPYRAMPVPKRLRCCSARIVVGTSTATCLPAMTDLNAARTATSVLPNPTSPQISRSMGGGDSMSRFTSTVAFAWSNVSSYMNDASSSCCHGVSAGKANPSAMFPPCVERDQIARDILDPLLRTRLQPVPFPASEAVQLRDMPVLRGVLLQLVDVADVHIQGVVLGVEHRSDLHIHFAHLDGPEPRKPADTEILMDDIVTFAELLHLLFGDSFEVCAPATPVAFDAAEDLVFGVHRQVLFGKRNPSWMASSEYSIAA